MTLLSGNGRAALATLFMCLAVGCNDLESTPTGDAAENNQNETPVVVVTSYPLLVMSQRIAGDWADVSLPIEPPATSRNWKPDTESITAIQSADAILLNGAAYDPWAIQASLPRSRTFDTSIGYSDELLAVEHSVTHQHGPSGTSAGQQIIWATWLDPQLASAQLSAVQKTLIRLVPDKTESVSQHAAAFDDEFAALDNRLEQISEHFVQSTVVVDGPQFGYLLRRLGCQTSFDLGGRDDMETVISEISAKKDSDRPQFFFHQSNIEPSVTEQLAASGIRPIEIDLCETEREQSLIERLNANLNRIESAANER